MRVLFFQHAGSLGGSVVSLGLTAAGLRERYSVDPVVCLTRPSEYLAQYYSSNFALETVAAPGLSQFHFSSVSPEPLYDPRAIHRLLTALASAPKTMRKAISIARKYRADIIHVNSLPLALITVAASQDGYPVVQHVREPSRSSWALRRSALALMSLRADARIFLSEYDRESWGAGPNDTIIPNFVDTSFMRPPDMEERRHAREMLGIRGDTFVVLYVGGSLQIKGAELVLQVTRSLRSHSTPSSSNFVLLMPGTLRPRRTGGFAEAYRSLRNRLGWPTLTDRVRGLEEYDDVGAVRILPLPPVRDMRRMYWASDLLIAPNTVPHFSRPVIEAAAAGRAAIASDLPGVRGLVVDGITGRLCAPEDVQDWCSALVTMAQSREQVRCMGLAARERATIHFDIRAATDLIHDVYRRLGR